MQQDLVSITMILLLELGQDEVAGGSGAGLSKEAMARVSDSEGDWLPAISPILP
jgi:hypothetical protein